MGVNRLKKILLVDDAIDFLQTLSEVFKKQCEVFTATGVQEALEMLDDLNVDVICSDLYMGDGTGVDLLQVLKQKNLQIPFILFILLSGSEENMDVRMAEFYGAVFIPKVNTTELLIKIEELTN